MRPLATIILVALLALASTACKEDKPSGSPDQTDTPPPPTPAADGPNGRSAAAEPGPAPRLVDR